MKTGRLLAIDYGTRNIGLACSDELGLTVRPMPSLHLKSRRDLVSRLRSAVEANDIRGLVLGIPLNMDGTSGKPADHVERLAVFLQKEFELPVRRVDERLSTVEALDIWKEMSSRQKRKYRTVDSLSAALILQRYLRE